MAVKATMYVYGSVQAVGYRVYVKNVAALMGVRGLVRNRGDGSVEIFAEAERDVLERFIKAIDVKGRPGDILSLNVERLEVRLEGEPGYAGPWRKYTQFEIDYGEEIGRPVEREMVESLELAKLYFTKLITEFKDFREEFRDYREEFRDYREEFRDYREEFRDYRHEFRNFRDESLSISREILGEVKGLKQEFRDYREEFRDYRHEFRNFRDESLSISREILGEVKGLKQEFRDYREEFRDFRHEFGDFRNGSLNISREILDTSKEVLGEVKGLRKDLQTILDERLTKIEKDIAAIKAKIGLL
jgi:acylphosphatase/predicted  nucleic acid-binding Zn-ribbon protein